MGLIRAAVNAIGGTLADQWKEYIYCDALDADVLVVKGSRKTSGRSANRKGEENVISDGSAISVAAGQCMIIVEQGQIVELCAEPGVFTYESKESPSIFTGDLETSVMESAKDIWERFKFGGTAGRDQRVYYFNIKEIVGNKYGTAMPVPFRVVDKNIGLDMDMSLRCNGEYSYRIVNPAIFFTRLCGNIGDCYERSEIDSQLKSEIQQALQPALAKLGQREIRYSEIPAYADDLAEELNSILSEKWEEARGIVIASFSVNSVSLSPEDEERIKSLQQAAAMKDPMLAMGMLASAQAEAMRTAAANQAGAMAGFMGMGMANQAGGINAQDLMAMAKMQEAAKAQAGPWTCQCGAENDGNFCPVCGSKRP